MYFALIRIITLFLFTATVLIVRYKSKKSFVKNTGFSLILLCVSILITFDNVQDVISYACPGNAEYILNGDNSCLVIYSKGNNTYSRFTLKKENDGYKIANFNSLKSISKNFSKEGYFEVCKFKNSDDYYVFFSINATENPQDIKLLNEDRKEKSVNIIRINESYFYYFYINESPEKYCISINGESATIPIVA